MLSWGAVAAGNRTGQESACDRSPGDATVRRFLVCGVSTQCDSATPSRKAARSKARPGCHTAAARGVLFISGPDVLPGAPLGGADPLDVAPTLAWLLGLPISKEMPGRPLTEAFRWEFVASLGRSDVDTYGKRKAAEVPATASPADEQMLEQLRGLGYIQ